LKVIVFGGDGFCGWPTALHLSQLGHDVTIVDNLSRRRIDAELGVESLTPIAPIMERLNAWQAVTGRVIDFFQLDIATDYGSLCDLLVTLTPDAVVHFAEQRAAPYSMKSAREKRYTVSNNVNATHNLLCSIVDTGLDIHLVHLGTMGVYGYGALGIDLPEGYLSIDAGKGPSGENTMREILYPVDPGSVYHLTKCQDQLLFYYYNKNDRVRITDLHQGVVWGTNTAECLLDERLVNRFDYDGDYGTVLNRFLMQAAINHPLTVYGTGGQTRGFIHLDDTVRCIEIALAHRPDREERVQIFNQLTEVYSVRELAHLVSNLTGVDITYLENPRNEANENDLSARPESLLRLGLTPTLLRESLLKEVIEIAEKYIERCDRSKIAATSLWRAAKP
jgi:UDP-sulfoquinovose synthase